MFILIFTSLISPKSCLGKKNISVFLLIRQKLKVKRIPLLFWILFQFHIQDIITSLFYFLLGKFTSFQCFLMTLDRLFQPILGITQRFICFLKCSQCHIVFFMDLFQLGSLVFHHFCRNIVLIGSIHNIIMSSSSLDEHIVGIGKSSDYFRINAGNIGRRLDGRFLVAPTKVVLVFPLSFPFLGGEPNEAQLFQSSHSFFCEWDFFSPSIHFVVPSLCPAPFTQWPRFTRNRNMSMSLFKFLQFFQMLLPNTIHAHILLARK
mmetsp:Transcript_11933/g.22340  ORF Transcript_11933/g.22340 Transcript_11933/m.22340 type:complete len:262 (-) Transcript_11933:658-1443(-)